MYLNFYECLVPNSKCLVLSFKCLVLSFKCLVLSFKCLVLSFKCLVSDLAYHPLSQYFFIHDGWTVHCTEHLLDGIGTMQHFVSGIQTVPLTGRFHGILL